MNKYLKGFLNLIIGLAIGFVGLLVSLNILVAGLMFFPYIATEVDQMMISSSGWVVEFVPGTLPLFFLLTVLYFTGFFYYKAIKLIKRVDVEKIIGAIQRHFESVSRKKEVKGK